MTTIVNLRNEKYDVYIGRGSKWGNPYSHKSGTLALYKVKSRSQAISNYENYILENESLLSSLEELKNKILGCFCKKEGHVVACHGDILLRLVKILDANPFFTHEQLVTTYKKLYMTKHYAINLF